MRSMGCSLGLGKGSSMIDLVCVHRKGVQSEGWTPFLGADDVLLISPRIRRASMVHMVSAVINGVKPINPRGDVYQISE